MLSQTLNSGTSSATTWKYTYEPKFSRIATITDPLGRTSSFAYDDPASSVTIADPLGHKTIVNLNHEGQPIQLANATGDSVYLSYLDGVMVAAADGLGDVSRQYNDAVGRPLQLTDPLGHATTYTWSPLDEELSQTDALGGRTAFTYDLDGDMTSVTDANGHTTKIAYNGMRWPVSGTDPLGHTQSMAYDAGGDIVSVTDPDGNLTTFTYDPLGRITQSKYGVSGTSSNKTITLTYDAGNRLTKAVDGVAGTYSLTYDKLNDILSAVAPQGTVSHTYNGDQLPTSLTVAGQPKVSYAYNADNDPTSITQDTSSVKFAYDADQRLISTTLPDGIVRKESFDAASRPAAVSFSRGSTQLGAQDYTYTRDLQLATESGSLATIDLPAVIASASYNADNELTALGSTGLAYDKEGNLTSNGTDSFSWNPEGQLAAVTGPSISASFTYDPLGRRATETKSGTTTSFLYDGTNPVQTLSAGKATANMLTGGLDQTYQIADSAGTSSLLTDNLGSTIALANASGALTTRYAYTPFGSTTASGPSNPNTFQYTGAQNDGTGLYYLENRYYGPALDRFISQDPSGFAGGTADLYQYADDQPTNLIDPTGLDGSSGGSPPTPWWRKVLNLLPHGLGVTLGADLETGLPGGPGSALQGEVGGGLFTNGPGVFASGGWFGGENSTNQFAVGEYLGGGLAGFLTNASGAEQLSQIPQTGSINWGLGGIGVSIQVGVNTETGEWYVQSTPTLPWVGSPLAPGVGASASVINTTTVGTTLFNW